MCAHITLSGPRKLDAHCTFSEDVLLEEQEKHEAEHGSQSPEQPQELHEGGPGQRGCPTKCEDPQAGLSSQCRIHPEVVARITSLG